VQKTVITI